GSDSRDLLAHLLHHTDVLVTHQLAIRGVRAAIGPQVGPADAGGHDPDHRIGRVLDSRVPPLLDPHITGSMHHNTAHRSSSPGLVAALAASAAVRGQPRPPRPMMLGWSAAWESLMMGVPGRTPSRTGGRPSLSSERSTTGRVRRPARQHGTEEERWTTGQRSASS